MSDNWIVQNLNSALNTWNEKLAEIWTLLTQSPESFKGGTIWSVITGINGALTAIGYGLLVLFFAAGIVKTCGSFTDMKKPEHALKAFIRFALAQGAIMYGMELMTALFSIVQGIVSTIMAQSGMADGGVTELPAEIVEKIEAVGMLESIPLWIVTLLGSLLITVLSFIMILTVYGRMFKLYMYTAIAPIPISTFAGEPSQSVGKNFIKSYAGVCLEGAIIALACIIFSVYSASPPAIGDTSLSAVTIVWNYVGELVFNLLVLVGAVKASDRFPARHIYTDSVKWCDFLSQDCPVRFAVEPAVLSLFFMIHTDVQKSFADDLHQFWIYFFICLFDLLFCNLNIVCSDICMIKFLRICKYCLILFFFYMSEDFLNSLFILTVIIRASLQKILQ